MTSARVLFGALIVVIISTTYVFVRSPAFGSRFEIMNDSEQDVTITAKFPDESRELGTILAEDKFSFTIRKQAAMILVVQYADGRKIETDSIYSTAGIPIVVSISNRSVDVQTDSDT